MHCCARSQADQYARALPAAEGRPPFVMVVDVGNVIELHAEFSRSGATYTPYPDPRSHRIRLADLADAAIRETKAISENFIGQLNTSDARAALKAQITATLTRMERAGALVPSTDGSDPAFLVDVYSTQLDFAQGIVRIDIAVRPVRAIDFIYATIRVKN